MALSVFCLFGACTDGGEPPIGVAPTITPSGSPGSSQEEADIYAAVIESMVKSDRKGRFGFDRIYIVDGPVDDAGDPMTGFQRSHDPFGDPMELALAERLRALPPVEFIAHAEDVQVGPQGMDGVKDHGLIITLEPIRHRSATRVHVGHSQWCGGLCGQWSTSVVKLIQGVWKVTGTTGPMAIS